MVAASPKAAASPPTRAAVFFSGTAVMVFLSILCSRRWLNATVTEATQAVEPAQQAEATRRRILIKLLPHEHQLLSNAHGTLHPRRQARLTNGWPTTIRRRREVHSMICGRETVMAQADTSDLSTAVDKIQTAEREGPCLGAAYEHTSHYGTTWE